MDVPGHVACIMDGNGRWAGSRGIPRIEGHKAGAKTVRAIVEESRKLGVGILTLFAFSTENWLRPEDEVNGLMSLFAHYLSSELQLMLDQDIRFRVIGRREDLGDELKSTVERVEDRTAHCESMQLCLAVSYGGREEIQDACISIAKDIASGKLEAAGLSAESFRKHLYAPDLPDPDLLIRTSGEFRISNFMLWQLAYTEVAVVPEFWPDFDVSKFRDCLEEFSKRSRRYGRTGEQLEKQ